ncbi:MAG: glucan 1,4-alpha-glucosidase [Acidobacteriia bacterium]|nr:glucan 1,4-alpha-glucosidase [Terriglobia bacterium]
MGSRAAGTAPDGPGVLSRFNLARKDCLGTASNTTSKVWYTVADGVLSDVDYPTIDTTNVGTLQYIVTDGSTFADLETRDMTYGVRSLDPSGMECRVTATAKSGAYQIVTDYITDPTRNTVLMRSTFSPLVPAAAQYRLYVRFDPTVNGNGGGGAGNGGGDSGTTDFSAGHPVLVAWDDVTATNAVNRDYAQPVYVALDASTGLREASSGFVGAPSDPLTQLDASHALTTKYPNAQDGNVVQVARLSTSDTFTLALGFGSTQAEAVGAAEASLTTGFAAARRKFEAGWSAYDAGLKSPPKKLAGVEAARWKDLVAAYYLNANLIKASEDKTFPGAIVAGLAAPWGQAVSAGDPDRTFVGGYREVFARDLYHAWTALLVDGDRETARHVVRFLFERQQLPDGSFPRNSLVNGKAAPDSFGTELDETSFPILMADQIGMNGADAYRRYVKPAAYFLAAQGPAFGADRWEEQGGFSPSTIAAEIAGLIAAADIADANGDAQSAAIFRGVADDDRRSVKGWTLTTNGPLSGSPYFTRLSKTGDPDAAISYNVGNGGPILDQRSVIDAGFLELVRLGEFPADDADFVQSLAIVDATIETTTASGPGWHRYNGDGYGDDGTDGHPWEPTGRGSGHVWPALSAERAEYALESRDPSTATLLLDGMARFAGGVGLIPEQDWELADLAPSPYGTDPTTASIGLVNGRPAGSAAPLTWSASSYVRLLGDLIAGRILEQPASTVDRYVSHSPGNASLTVAGPPDASPVYGSLVTVTGTSDPGNTIYLAATNTDTNSRTTTVSTPTNPDGSFTIPATVTGGTTVLNVVAVSPSGATAHVKRSVFFDFTPGTVLLDVTDPSNDDNGPGNYAYPASSEFHAGAFDLEEFQVILSPDSQTTTFKAKVRDLTPTFGSGLGAQLLDVYVRDPGAAPADTSLAASFPQRNYSIAPGSAWSRLIEVQGFGQRFIDAHGNTLGSVTIGANAISRFITFSVPTSSLGGIAGSGWGFTVVLTGQDGFSPDQARGFAPTPQPFLFGVCATASADVRCTVDPGSVPRAVDVLTPPGVLQSEELDYTVIAPTTLQGVMIP